MDAEAPANVIPISCAPKTAPCPKCGRKGRLKRRIKRKVRSIAYKEIVFLEVTYGEYKARCKCCTTFRTNPEGILPKAKYDNKVREAVLDGILEDHLNVEAIRRRMERDFLLDLSTGFVYDCLKDAAKQLDMAQHRQQVLQRFSGVLCIDELHLGKFTLLLATDPVGDFPVAFALVSGNDQEHMGRFLRNLKRGGLEPKVVVTDGSTLYPAVLAELWPKAEHQLCVFHVMQDLNKLILDAVRRLRKELGRQGCKGRRRKRGRPSKAQQRRRAKKGLTIKDKAKFVFKHRYLIVQRQENLSERERDDLKTMLAYLSPLRVLRKFTDALHRLFDPNQSEHQAWCRWRALRGNAEFQAIPELAEALASLEKEKFHKMIAFLRGPAGRRVLVRTNNHVERCNRKLRYMEKVRYKWRRRRTLVRFIVLALDRWWKEKFSNDSKQPKSTQHETGKKTRAKPTVTTA
jgi:transposase-like protein